MGDNHNSLVREIAISSLFGAIIFLEKAVLPAIYDKIISVFLQMLLLSLSFLIAGFTGPVLTGFISGLLTALTRSSLGWMTFTFSLLYGFLVSVLYRLLGVVRSGEVRAGRLMAGALISTLLVGVMSAMTSMALKVVPYNPKLVVLIMIAGSIQGLVGGFLSLKVYMRYIKGVYPVNRG